MAAACGVPSSALSATESAAVIETALPDAPTGEVRRVLGEIIHGAEDRSLKVHIVSHSQIQSECGRAEACYSPTDPEVTGSGEIWLSLDFVDWQRNLIHEYGHHLDNQLINLGSLRGWGFPSACSIDEDGARRWMFARMLGPVLRSGATGCGTSVGWDDRLSELFAEDFVMLNGGGQWQLKKFPPPTPSQLEALKFDLEQPFERRAFSKRKRTQRGSATFIRRLNVEHGAFLSTDLRGKARFKVEVTAQADGRKIATARGRSKVRLSAELPPGAYEVRISASPHSAGYRATFSLR